MSKPGADPSSGISLGDVLRLPKRHPACRRREAQSGSCTERENLAGDAKGKGASGSNREAESTDALERDVRHQRSAMTVENYPERPIFARISYALTEAMDEAHCGLPTAELIPLAEKPLEVPQELTR